MTPSASADPPPRHRAQPLAASGWRLFRLCLSGPRPWIGLLLFAAVALLDLASIPIGLSLIQWNADFFNALQKVDGGEAVRQIGVFGLLTLLGASRFLVASFLRKHLQLLWRTALTRAVLDIWLADKTFWRLERERTPDAAGEDNTDQRIADDCRIFVEKLTTETLELLTACVALASYVTVLWSLSAFPLQFTLFGQDVEIARYMVWAAALYVALSTGVTHWLGKPLYALSVRQQQKEADFRFALARMREHAEPIAIWSGEAAERRILLARFGLLAANFRRIITRELVLGIFTRPYQQTVLQIPLFLALPAYLAKQVTLGGLMQLRSAFQNVVTNLSYFIFSYRDITELAAATRRLSGFIARAGHNEMNGGRRVQIDYAGDDRLSWRDLVLAWPGKSDLRVPDLKACAGEHIWISGPSGAGKSTLVRLLAGLPQPGSGTIALPAARMMTTSQRSYEPLADLADAAVYPLGAKTEAADALERVGLDPNRPLETLSGGERQRLALARALIDRPDWLVLDEPFANLDHSAASSLARTILTHLPTTTLIIVSHGKPPRIPFTYVIDLCSTVAVAVPS
jgi:putative ATP-binding cassette transporter